MNRMENIRTRSIGIGESNAGGGKNYTLKGVLSAMVRKVEENRGGVQMWLSIGALLVAIGTPFLPWVKDQIIANAVMAERMKYEKEDAEARKKQSDALISLMQGIDKKVDELKARQEDLEEKVNSRVRPRKGQQQAVRGKPSTMNGSVLQPRADYATMSLPNIGKF